MNEKNEFKVFFANRLISCIDWYRRQY